MNPLTNVKNIAKLNEQELKLGISGNCSWHKIYKHSPWVFIGGLDYDLTEGDVVCVFSQYGEVEDINLVRDKKTGKSKGFCFLCYQNKTSTTLAVDNFNGIKLCGRTIRVDHVANYRPPKEEKTEETKESEEDSTSFLKPLLQNTFEDEKPRQKDKQHKESTNEQLSNEKHPHKSTKSSVPSEVTDDSAKSHKHHHRARNLSDEKSHKGILSKHTDKDNYKHRKTERRHFSSDENLSDEKSHKGGSSRHYSDTDNHKRRKTERRHSSSDESTLLRHKPKKAKYKDVSCDKKQKWGESSSDESVERTKHRNKHKHKKHKHKESRH